MTNVKVLHLLLTFQGPNFYMMAVLDYFIEIIFLFCNLIVGKTKINKNKRQKKNWEVGEGRISISTGRPRTYRSLCVSPRTRYNHLDAAQVFLFPFVTGVC